MPDNDLEPARENQASETDQERRARIRQERRLAYAAELVTGKKTPRQAALAAGVPESSATAFVKRMKYDPTFYKDLVKASGAALESEYLPIAVMVCVEIMQNEDAPPTTRARCAQIIASLASNLRSVAAGQARQETDRKTDRHQTSPASLIIEIWNNRSEVSSGQVIENTSEPSRLVVGQQTVEALRQEDDQEDD